MSNLKLYNDIAAWWPLLSAPADYEEEAVFFSKTLMELSADPPKTLLELGSGGGNNALHMKKHFKLTLVDLSEAMLNVSRGLNPKCEHLAGDMRTVRLDRQFDTVFIHDAIEYMTTRDDLLKAIQTAFVHCRPGGVALFVPDNTRENFEPGTDWGGHDGEHRSMRFLEWTWDPDPSDSTYIVDYTYQLRETSGAVKIGHDRHIFGLFSRSEWLELITEAGFEAQANPYEHSELEPGKFEVFVGIRPKREGISNIEQGM